MAELVVFTNTETGVLPALELMSHKVISLQQTPSNLVTAAKAHIFLVDAVSDLSAARKFCSLIQASGLNQPVMAVLTEGALPAMSTGWGCSDFILSTAGPAEIDARLRLSLDQANQSHEELQPNLIQAEGLMIDEANYSAKTNGKLLDLTFKEFELLRYMAAHPGRVFTREQLLSEVWGYDYYGGTRTVDVHVRRLRSKLGELDKLIGTVRNVGYRFNLAEDEEQ